MLSNNGGAGLKGLALAALGAVAMSACDADRENFISPIGDVILDFSIGLSPSGIPAGEMTVDTFTLVAVDLAQPGDGLGRAGSFETDAIRGVSGCATESGDCPGFDYLDGVRTASTDTRSPALLASSAAVGLFGITADGVQGDPLFLASLGGLAPSTQYFVALERLATQVNGIPDHAAILLENPTEFGTFATDADADPDDALVPLDGTGGTAVGSNPFVFGSFTTSGGGAAFALLFLDGGGGDDYQETNIADGMGLGANQYNYIVIYQGDPLAGGTPVLRTQIGQEVTPANEPIPTNFAPFPTAPFDALSALAPATCCVLSATDVTVELTDLVAINGVYQAWLVNDATDEVEPLVADLVSTDADDVVVESGSGVSTFDGGADRTITLTISETLQGRPLSDFTHIFVTIEASAAATPSAVQPLWVRYLEVDAADPADPFGFSFTSEDDLTFGTFETGDSPVPFDPGGFGQGAFTGAEFGTADLFRARFRNITLPPVGYFYEGFLRSIDEGAVVADVSTGDLTTEFAEGFASLRDVDVDRSISAQIGPTTIIESANRATLAEVGSPFETFDTFVLRLRPKAAAGATSGSVLLQGTLPETLKAREETE